MSSSDEDDDNFFLDGYLQYGNHQLYPVDQFTVPYYDSDLDLDEAACEAILKDLFEDSEDSSVDANEAEHEAMDIDGPEHEGTLEHLYEDYDDVLDYEPPPTFDDDFAGGSQFEHDVPPQSQDRIGGQPNPGGSSSRSSPVGGRRSGEGTRENTPEAPVQNNVPLAYEVLPPPPPPLLAYERSSEHAAVRFVMLLTVWLHTSHQVSHAACSIILFAFRLFLKVLVQIIPDEEEMPITLPTVLKRFRLVDRFTVVPLCPRCHAFFSPPVALDKICPSCRGNIRIFPEISKDTQVKYEKRKRNPPPYLAAPFRPLSDLLYDLLPQIGVEEALDAWRRRHVEVGWLRTIMDANIWKELKDRDGAQFFGHRNDDELRLGVTLSMDW
jgi:hypothetical protein